MLRRVVAVLLAVWFVISTASAQIPPPGAISSDTLWASAHQTNRAISISSSGDFTSLDQLQQPLTAGNSYICWGKLYTTVDSASGIKIGLFAGQNSNGALPTLVVSNLAMDGLAFTTTTVSANPATVTSLGAIVGVTAAVSQVYFSASFQVTTSGILQAEAELNTGSTAATVLVGSWMICQRSV